MTVEEKCPRCGGETEADEVDVGPGVVRGPRGCPACFWVEGDPVLNPIPLVLKTCKECRFVGTHTRPKIISKTGFGDQLMFENADKDETVYTCRAFETLTVLGDCARLERLLEAHEVLGQRALSEHAGKEIGVVPITCPAWAAPVASAKLSKLDEMIAARDARAAARTPKEGK